MNLEALDQITAQILKEWGHQVEAMLKSRLTAKKLVLSGDLYESLKTDVNQAASGGTQQLLLSFLDEGRINEMSKISYKQMPPIEAFEKYVQKVGVNNFSYVPGFRKGNSPISKDVAINRIAWGIAMDRKNRHQWTPKKWFAKPFYSMIGRLIDDLVTKYQEATGQVIAGGFKY